jgi:hypothetical protein
MNAFKNRKAVNFYRSYYDVFKMLPHKERLEFIEALLDKQFTGEEPTLDGLALFAYTSQKYVIDQQVNGFLAKIADKTKHPSEGGWQGGTEGGRQGPWQQEKEKEQVKEQDKEKVKVKEKPTRLKPIQVDTFKLWSDLLKAEKTSSPLAGFLHWLDALEPGALHHLYPINDTQLQDLSTRYGREVVERKARALLSAPQRSGYKNLYGVLSNWCEPKKTEPTVKRKAL